MSLLLSRHLERHDPCLSELFKTEMQAGVISRRIHTETFYTKV